MTGRGLITRLAMWPLSVVSGDLRAAALERLSSASTASAAVPGATLTFFAPTPLLRKRAETLLTKEPDMIAWLQQLPPEAVLWDIGANVGVFSLYAAASRKCRVLSFEPSAANFYVLTRNIQLNHLEARISAYCVALSGETKLGVLNLDSAALGGSMTQFGEAGEISRYSTGGRALSHGMVGMTIDEFVTRFAPTFPTHVKMDVDGLELPILEGAINTLRDSRIKSAMVELSLSNPAERDRAIAILAAAGLDLVSQGESQGNAGETAANHLFVRR
jgi:FkbM family methyltransferase